MARTITAIMALVALLALSACNSVTGPDRGTTTGGSIGNKDRGLPQVDSPDILDPSEGDVGGGSYRHPLNRIRRPIYDRQREEVSPVDENGGGGGEAGSTVVDERLTNRRRGGKEAVTPGN
jgi:hypothetical protein